MENPFLKVNYAKKERKVFEPDVYFAKLEKLRVFEFDDKENPGQKKTKLAFDFKTDAGDEISAAFYPSKAENSQLVGWLSKTIGADRVTAACKATDWKDAMWKLCNSLVGKRYKISVSVNGQYNNIDWAKEISPSPAPAIDNGGDIDIPGVTA